MSLGQARRPAGQGENQHHKSAGSKPGSRQVSGAMGARMPLGESSRGNTSGGHGGAARDASEMHKQGAAGAGRAAGEGAGGNRVAALARRPRLSAVGGPGAAGSSLAPPPAAIRVDSTSFEEWMKMATDNKINSTNTWNFALIDYFHDMSLLRNDSGDGSINFQKASCTLDGCIKVWTSRVDSVVVETGRLLNGLQDDLNGSGQKGKRGKGDGDDDDLEGGSGEEGEGDEEGGAGAGGKKRKRTKAKDSTLAKDFSQIQIKKLELEFTVDPLFKKTSADFDEGGAGGLLMNHLGVDHQARIVFDAGDAVGIADDEAQAATAAGADIADTSLEEGADDAAAAEAAAGQHTTAHVPVEMIDITKLRAKLIGGLEEAAGGQADSLAQLLSRRAICPTLASFRFSKDDTSLFDDLAGGSGGRNGEDDEDRSFDNSFAAGAVGFGGDYDDQLAPLEDDMPDMDGEVDFFADAAAGAGYAEGGEHGADDFDDFGGDDFGAGAGAAPGAGLVPNRNGPDLFMALGDLRATDGEDGAGLFDFFDQRLAKNWAGPEHWKMRRAVPAAPKDAGVGDDGERGRSSKKVKEPFVIDFMSEEGAISSKELFEADTRGTSINLPKKAKGATQELYLLPEDRHFNSKQLLRLFTKPRMALNIRRHGDRLLMQDAPQEDEVNDEFWAEAAAAREGGSGGFDDSLASNAAPYETQSQYDYNDELPPLDDGQPISFGNGTEEVDMDESALLGQASRKVKPEYVNYAKKAKRVDVRKLKDTIWKELAIPQAGPGSDSGSESAPSTPIDEPRTFLDVVGGLRKTYPKDKMEEISTSFCFICLLHLANEEGLSITAARGPAGAADDSFASGANESLASGNAFERMAKAGMGIVSTEDDDALGEEDGMERVGALEWLRIAKDPNAGRSA